MQWASIFDIYRTLARLGFSFFEQIKVIQLWTKILLTPDNQTTKFNEKNFMEFIKKYSKDIMNIFSIDVYSL